MAVAVELCWEIKVVAAGTALEHEAVSEKASPDMPCCALEGHAFGHVSESFLLVVVTQPCDCYRNAIFSR